MERRSGGGGVVACFNGLYEAHHRALHAYFLGRTGDPGAAEDLLQEAFLRAWRNIWKLHALLPDRRRYWLYAVARNLVTDYYRGRASRRETERAVSEEAERGPEPDSSPGDTLALKERMDELERAIGELPEELRVVLTLKVAGELSSARIGELLELPAGTVRYRLSAARKRLAGRMLLDGSGLPERGGV